MERTTFVKSMVGFAALGGLSSVRNLATAFSEEDYTFPVLFIGHGSPMNGIEDNSFSQQWAAQVKQFPNPKAVLVISAHWLTKGTAITAMDFPTTIHDFGGFPQELFDVNYPAPGNPELAKTTQQLITSTNVQLDHEWGLDHGTWTVVKNMYPDATIPVLQLSIDYSQPAVYHYNLAKELLQLRKKGVLIIGSGNMVHNLGKIDWDKMDVPNYGHDWAIEAHEVFNRLLKNRDHKSLIDYKQLGASIQLAIPTPDHYLPLLYTLGLSNEKDELAFFNNELVGGSLNMTSVKFG